MSGQYVGVSFADGQSGSGPTALALSTIDSGVRAAIDPPECRAYQSSTTSVANAGADTFGTAVSFNAEDFDTDTIHDNATNPTRLTARTNGRYVISAGAEFAAQATAVGVRQLSIRLNGTTILKKTKLVLGTPYNAEAVPLGVQCVASLVAGDYVELGAYQTSGASLNLSAPSASVEASYLSIAAQSVQIASPAGLPKLLQVGTSIVDSALGSPIYLRGAGVSTINMVGTGRPNMYKTVKTLLNRDFLTIRVTWDDYEPTRPTGGDPTLGGGHGETRNYSAAFESKFVEIMDYCEANQIYFVVRMGHTGAGGVTYLGGSNGIPDWLYQDSLWSPAVAPLPADRAGYGGPYPVSSVGLDDADTAWWVPFTINDTNLAQTTKVSNLANTIHWKGDWDKVYSYLYPFLLHLQQLSQGYSYCVGYNWFNEPDIGNLNEVGNYNEGATHKKSVERVMRSQTQAYDALRATEPYRWQATHGEGGHNWCGTTDFSIYWTGGVGGGGTCPSNIHFCLEQHLYCSGQGGLIAPNYDKSDALFNQQGLGTYAPTGGSPSTYINDIFDRVTANAARWGMPVIVGEYGIDQSDTNATQFPVDMDTGARRNKTHTAIFALAAGSGDAILTAVGDTYTLNTLGTAYKTVLDVPY